VITTYAYTDANWLQSATRQNGEDDPVISPHSIKTQAANARKRRLEAVQRIAIYCGLNSRALLLQKAASV
jgi:hypothetical protein